MSFVTFGQLANEGIVEGMTKLAKSTDPMPDVFLSHSHRDEGHVSGVAAILGRRGASVYVDVFDRELSLLSMKQKCDRVRAAVGGSRKLIVIFTNNTSTSRWIPWELGLADGARRVTSIATFPLSNTATEETWGTQEYFGLYPQVRWVTLNGQAAPRYAVLDPSDGKYWTLEAWLSL